MNLKYAKYANLLQKTAKMFIEKRRFKKMLRLQKEMHEAFVEFRKNKEKKKLKMIKEFISETSLDLSWARISNKAADQLK